MTTPTRPADRMRPVTIEPFPTQAAGSVLISQGRTRVLCTAAIEPELPRWLAGKPGEPAKQGWVTAEYAMLPGATTERKKRGADGRGTEIQRLIGRVLRAAVNLEKMPGVMITCDCDVVSADGGTRTAAITGAWVALAQCLDHARAQGRLIENPLRGPVAAVSVGIVEGCAHLDLDYSLDVRAEVDMNVAMNHRGQFIEVQGTAEHAPFSRRDLDEMLNLARRGIRQLMAVQRKAIESM